MSTIVIDQEQFRGMRDRGELTDEQVASLYLRGAAVVGGAEYALAPPEPEVLPTPEYVAAAPSEEAQ
jgi:hypothetical protein